MRIITLDTETTGFPNTQQPPEHPSQPEILSLGWILSEDETPISQGQIFVEGNKSISQGAAEVNGLDRNFVNAFGVDKDTAAVLLLGLLDKAELVLGYNIEFDLKMIDLWFTPINITKHRSAPKKCVMSIMTNICKLPKQNGHVGFKRPKLIEAYQHCFPNHVTPDTHRALDDCFSTLSIYHWIKSVHPDKLV